MSTLIISEIGSNHNGDLDNVRKLVEVSKDCGADAVKFQMFTADSLYSKNVDNFDKYENVFEMISDLQVYYDFFDECYSICKQHHIEFMATPFSAEAVDFLTDREVYHIKIASFEFTDIRLVKHIARTGIPVIASTGLASEKDITDFLLWTSGYDVTLLHCNSAYPTPPVDAHLAMIPLMVQKYNVPVGYSDHTEGIVAPCAAVALGASVIEKHLTLDRNMDGPDHNFAIEPEELKVMIRSIREVESMLGEPRWYRTQSEKDMFYARRSVVMKKNKISGDIISENDITTKRPGSGIPASEFYNMIGLQLKNDVETDHILQWKDLK